jgi:mono/diheme cytochrome c family protein
MKPKLTDLRAGIAGTLVAAALAWATTPALADQTHDHSPKPIADSDRGRALFVDKGCILCHAVNGTGGDHASPLDAHGLDDCTGSFGLFARMWRAAPAMIAAQEQELGAQIDLSGAELADLFAFLLDHEAQHHFTPDQLDPDQIKAMQAHPAGAHAHKP